MIRKVPGARVSGAAALVVISCLSGSMAASSGVPVDPVPWEAGETIGEANDRHLRLSELARLEISLIGVYQTQIGPNSISRCPFSLSCSRYAVEAIRTKGAIVGLLYFVDRYFYRENAGAYRIYPRRVADDGRLTLDDTWILRGDM